MAKRKKNTTLSSKKTIKKKSKQKDKKSKLIKVKAKKASTKKIVKEEKKVSALKETIKKTTKKQTNKLVKQKKSRDSKEKKNINEATIELLVEKQERDNIVSVNEAKKEENTELLNKIVNASITEETKVRSSVIKRKDEESEVNNDSTSVTEEPSKKKRRRRKRIEKTWEEKAKTLPVFEVSNFPKLPVRSILITQSKPADLQNPYQLLIDKYNINITFRPFVKVEGLTEQEFRNQRVNVLEYKNIIFTSRLAIDHFFRILSEMRISMPDTTKYFCLNEQLAYYMQKHMELRKRRIFWGSGSLNDLKNTLKKNIDGKFLLPASDTIKEKVTDLLDNIKAKYTVVNLYKTIPENISDIRPEKYDMIVFFTPIAVEALKKYFPNFKQNKTRFAAYSILTANKIKELGYRVDVYAPTLEFPSLVNAIAHYLLHVGER